MPGLSKVIVLDPDVRAGRQVQLGFEREGVPTQAIPTGTAALELPGDDAGLVVVGGVDGQGLDLVRRARALLDDRGVDAPIVFAGRGVARDDARAAGADEVVLQPAFLRDVVTIGRLLRGVPASQRTHLVGNLMEITGVYSLVRAFTALGRSATLTLIRGLRRGEIRFYHGEVTSAQVGMIHGQAALHQLLLWTDARFDFHHEDVVRRQQIPLTHAELFADAERFLESVRGSSGGLSPSVVLEPNVPRVQSLGKQIPTEVYGVLRMFDGHRMLADVLEDSPYRVFETLRVAQRAVEAGLLRVVDHQPPRASWRAVLAIEQWLVGSDAGEIVAEVEPIAPALPGAPARPPDRDARDKGSRKRRKKRRRVDTPAIAVRSPVVAREIDWGALVPRTVGAEVGPLAGVVPAAHVSGEIVMASPAQADPRQDNQPKVVLDAAATPPEPPAGARAEAMRVAATVSRSSEPPHAVDDPSQRDTKPERAQRRPQLTKPGMAVAEASTVVAHDVAGGETGASGATTTRTTAPMTTTVTVRDSAAPEPGPRELGATSEVSDASKVPTVKVAVPSPADIAAAERLAEIELAPPPPAHAEPARSRSARPSPNVIARGAARAPSVRAASPPVEVTDEPSDGVIRQHIVTAETAPVKRRRLPSDPPDDDDRPGDATGEITMSHERATAEPRHSEPSILVADLAAVHSSVSAIADDRVTAPITVNAKSPLREAQIATARSDAVAFDEIEEAFFRAGHDKDKDAVVTVPPPDSFDDLDEGYRPLGFWDRLRGKPPPRSKPKPKPNK